MNADIWNVVEEHVWVEKFEIITGIWKTEGWHFKTIIIILEALS